MKRQENFTSQGSNFYSHLSFENENLNELIDPFASEMRTQTNRPLAGDNDDTAWKPMKDVCHIKPPPNNM